MIIVRNISGSEDTWCGTILVNNTTYTIPTERLQMWRENTEVIQDIADSKLQVENESGLVPISPAEQYKMLLGLEATMPDGRSINIINMFDPYQKQYFTS